MTTKTRIYATHGEEHATIWPIGCGEYYHVHWEEADEDTVYSSENVDKAFEEGNWVAVQEDSIETYDPVRIVEFSVADGGCDKYRIKIFDDESTLVSWKWNNSEEWCEDHEDLYTVKEFENNVAEGDWEITSDSSKKKLDVANLQIKIEIPQIEEYKVMLDEMVEQSNTVLERIKPFTTGTGHDVFITEGIYKVYRAHEDMPYVAQNEEELIKIIDALIVLDNAETE